MEDKDLSNNNFKDNSKDDFKELSDKFKDKSKKHHKYTSESQTSNDVRNLVTDSPIKSPVSKVRVGDIDPKRVLPQRAGVIIYTMVEDTIYIGLGLDSRSHDLTDFGGSVKYRADGNAIVGALREFQEETLDIFEPLKIQDIKDCPVIYDENNLIIFINLNIDPNVVSQKFNKHYEILTTKNKLYNALEEPEVCGITWFTWHDFQHIIWNKSVMFSRVQNFLRKTGDFSFLL